MSLLLKYGMNITFSTSARRSFYIKCTVCLWFTSLSRVYAKSCHKNRLSTWHFNLNEYFYRVCPGTLCATWSARSSMAVGWLMTMTSASWTHLQRCGSMRTCSALISTSTKATASPDAIMWISISNMFRWDRKFQWNCSVSLFGISRFYLFCLFRRRWEIEVRLCWQLSV